MKKSVKYCIAAALVAVTASLSACSSAPTESEFDNPRPWHDDVSIARNISYERLEYTVDVYDTTTGLTPDKRVTIGTGSLCFELTESLANERTTLNMSFSVTYNDQAPERDRGLTDTIQSTVRFSTGSLAAQYMEKTVTLADRKNAENLSYTVTADYHGNQTATLVTKGSEPKTLELSKNTCRDNEMMFYLARAQAITTGKSTMFKMINVYESFGLGKTTEYMMYAQASTDKVTVDIGNFVQDFGVEAVKDQTGAVSYPISCYSVNISRDGSSNKKVGPPYTVLYTEKPFKSGEKSHAKIPVRISYSEYQNNNLYRYTEYTLNACSFDKN